MLPKEDRISYKAMLDIPLPGICYPRRQNKLKRDVRNAASRYTLPKEDRISSKAMLDIPLPGICYPRKTE